MPTNTNPAHAADRVLNALSASSQQIGSTGGVSEKDWTGFYTISLVVLKTRIEAARAALPKGLNLDESYGSTDGWYPILVSFGQVENARPRVGGGIGFNYCEAFSAIPGVQVEQPTGGPLGPYLYPYRGYLDHLIPVVLGRWSGFRKCWERISVVRHASAPHDDEFLVKSMFLGKPIMEGQCKVEGRLEFGAVNLRLQRMKELLPPNLVGINPLGKLVRSVFTFNFDDGLAWNLSTAILHIHVDDFVPGITEPIDVDYTSVAETNNRTNSVVWTSDDRYLPVRAFVQWRLIS